MIWQSGGGVGVALSILIFNFGFDIKTLIKEMFPFIVGNRWFVKAYILLLLFIPFINKVISVLEQKSYIVLLIILTCVFSIWPSFLPQPPIDDYGYGFIHFIYLYFIGAYLRKYNCVIHSKAICAIGYVISAAFVYTASKMGFGYAWAYNFPFVISESVFLFLFFLQIKVDSSIINKLALNAFGVFLVHTNPFFRVLIYENVFNASYLLKENSYWLVVSVILCVPVFYLFGAICESVKKWICRYSLDCILDRFPLINKETVIR